MSAPAISVLMPVYNAGKYLAEALDSVLVQTFSDFEFIIVDDGSTDGSLAILKKYADQDGRIRLISRPNTGYVVALNEMLGLAQGEFVARMDADDISLPNRFERQLDFLNEHADHIAVGASILLIDSDGDPLCSFQIICDHESIDREHMNGSLSQICHPSLMARREILLRLSGYRSEFEPAEDFDLFLRLAEFGRLANVPETLIKYRRHAQATGYTRHCEQVHAKNRAIRDALRRRGLPDRSISEDSPRPPAVADQHRTWAWWALGAGHVRTARKHALAALRRNPLSASCWRVVYCSFRGY